MAITLYNAFSSGKNFITGTIKTIAPYQPLIATASILGKSAWKYRGHQKLKNEVRDLTMRINRLNQILNTHEAPSAEDPRRMERVREQRAKLKADLKEKKYQLDQGYLAFWQIPSLFFSHPGSNPYQSVHSIYQRGFTINHQAAQEERRLSTLATVAACSVSILGTTASFLRLTSAIESDNQLAWYLTTAALTVHLTEGTLASIRTIQSAYARYGAQ